MDYNSICAELNIELEKELSDRLDEIVSLENIYSMSSMNENERCTGVFYKSLIILLYAHFEGYCKKVLLFYINYLNSLNLTVETVKDGLAATNLYGDFGLLFDTNRNPVVLGEKSLREDRILQSFGRRREFVGHYRNHISKTINIPDDVVDTESNLKSSVLKKLLFILEIDHTIVDDFATEVNELVHIRNAYAHGDLVRLPEKNQVDQYRQKTESLMKIVKDAVYRCFCEKNYLNVV